MMTKQELLAQITQLAAAQQVTEVEVTAAYRAGRGEQVPAAGNRLGIAEVLYYIGGAIVFLGIAVLIGQNWIELTSATRILATLGASIAAYVMSILFHRYETLKGVSQAFALISALVAPIGLAVTFHEAGIDAGSFRSQTIMAAILLVTYLLSHIVFRNIIWLIFSIIFGTWLFFSVTSLLVAGRPQFNDIEFYEYRILLAGLSYILLGYAFAQRKLAELTGWLYGVGIIAFLGAALALGGWQPEQNLLWEALFPGLALGTVFLGVSLKSRAFLVFGALYLMIYIIKITAEYFTDTLGWPLALVIAGLSLIAIGYGTLRLNKKYLGN